METYILTIKQVKLIGKKEFTVAALDLEHKAFIIHVAAFSINLSNKVHLSKKAQIADLKVDKSSNKDFSEYPDFADVFSPKLATKLSEHTRINDHAIELVDD